MTLHETFPSHFASVIDCRILVYEDFMLIASLIRYIRWQFDKAAIPLPIFQTAFGEHLPTSFSFIKLHLFDFPFPRRAAVTPTTEDVTRWKGGRCQHMNMLRRYLHKLQQHLCQHMPPILKLNEQVIQMTYKVKW